MSTAKTEVESLLRRLPEDCTLEDVQYHLYVMEKVQRGLERAETEGALSQKSVKERLSKGLTRKSWRHPPRPNRMKKKIFLHDSAGCAILLKRRLNIGGHAP